MTPVDLANINGLQQLAADTTVRIRLIPYGALAPHAGFYINGASGSDLELDGTLTP
jgi:hypothetical protein